MSDAQPFQQIPVVDIAGLAGDDPGDRQRTADALGAAARDVGFAYLTGHGVDPVLFDRLTAVTEAFFALPQAEKMRTWIGQSSNHRGYVPPGEEVFAGALPDEKEAFDLGLDLPDGDPSISAAVAAGAVMLGPNQWPDVPGFQEAVSAWYDAVQALSTLVFRGFALALGGPEDLFLRHVSVPPSQLRLLHYPYNPTASDRPGIGAHTDYECFTLLRPTAPGLEVMNSAGQWIDAPLVEGAFVLNVGDMLELWTNGTFVATSHRVRRVTQERYAFPFFCSVDWHTQVSPLPRFMPDTSHDGAHHGAHPARPTVIAGEHLWAQTIQTFSYLRDRLAHGTIALPDGALGLSSFGPAAAGLAAESTISS